MFIYTQPSDRVLFQVRALLTLWDSTTLLIINTYSKFIPITIPDVVSRLPRRQHRSSALETCSQEHSKKFPSPPLDRCAPNHLVPIASASQYGHYYLQTYFKIWWLNFILKKNIKIQLSHIISKTNEKSGLWNKCSFFVCFLDKTPERTFIPQWGYHFFWFNY